MLEQGEVSAFQPGVTLQIGNQKEDLDALKEKDPAREVIMYETYVRADAGTG